jgi:PilZ domain
VSTLTEYMDGLNTPAERRFYPRVTPPTPIYVAFGSNNLGVLHNVSENGFQVVTPSELPLNSVYRIFLSLNGAAKTISVTVRTIWTTGADKRAGIQLLDLADEDRQQIRQWVELELSRNENSTPWALPKNGEDAQAPTNRQQSELRQQSERSVPRYDGNSIADPSVSPLPKNEVRTESAREVRTEPAPTAAFIPPPAPQPPAPRTPRAAATPPPAHATPKSSAPEPFVAATSAEEKTELPPIANPFDDPGPNPKFEQFPSVPLPIHGEFEYGKRISSRRRRVSTWSSHLRAKPLILWAVALALVCVGANALVKYKIKQNARRYANESAAYVPPKSDLELADSPVPADDSGANTAAPASGASDSTSASSDANSKEQTTAPVSPNSAAATPARNDSRSASNGMASRSAANQPAQLPPRRESSLDSRENQAYTATAPPSSDRSEETVRSSQPTVLPRTWSAPAPTRSSSTAAANDAPQSPNVVGSSNNVPVQSAPIVSQTRPTPPPAPAVQASNTNTSVSSMPASNSSSAVNNTPARTPPSNTQSSTYASNTNATATRPQSPIYNANAPQQRSAIMSSINSVHSSGIFDSNDSTNASASAAPAAAPRGNANANVAARPVSSKDVIPTDTPQERDIEIAAPKGFTASYVDLPGEHVVRAAGTTIHIRRLVRVPGERVPGQRWLWKGRLNVTLGDVVNRIDPSVVQASGATGSLTVQATIDKDGYVTDVKPLYGNFGMLPSVSRAVRNWRYDPTYLDSKRAETQAQIEFNISPASATNRPAH